MHPVMREIVARREANSTMVSPDERVVVVLEVSLNSTFVEAVAALDMIKKIECMIWIYRVVQRKAI